MSRDDEGRDGQERKHKLTLLFVVSGQNVELDVNVETPFQAAIARALETSRNTGRPPQDWELRDERGTLIDPATKIGDYRLANGTRLFLTLRVGAGG